MYRGENADPRIGCMYLLDTSDRNKTTEPQKIYGFFNDGDSGATRVYVVVSGLKEFQDQSQESEEHRKP